MKKIWAFVLALPVLFLLTACPSGKTDGNGGEELQIFKYNQASGISSLDPAFSKDQATIWATNQLFNGLVQLDNDLNIKPAIAEDWDISEDGLTYTFYLRDDVYFHDHEAFEGGQGRAVTAQDFAYSLNRIIDPKVASPGAWIFEGKLADAKPFEAIDEHTFVLHLKQPFRPMLGILTMQYCYVVPKEVVAMFGKDFRANPVGTGPFQLKSWQEGTSLVMVKNPRYFEQDAEGNPLPYLDGLKVSFIDNKKTEYLTFMQGDLHFMSGLDASYIDEMLNENGELKEDKVGKVELMKSPYLNTEYLGITLDATSLDVADNPLLIKEVRQALNYGFDRNEMVQLLRNGIGIPANAGFVPQGLPSFDAGAVNGYTYDPEKAKALLTEAGYPNGEGMPPITLLSNESYKDIAVYISKQLEDIGVVCNVEMVQASILREWMANGKAPFFRGSWIADYPDAESYLALFYSPYGAPPNYTRFMSEEYDALYQQAMLENDNTKRYNLYHQMDNLLMEEAPVIPLFYDEVLRFVQPGVKGMQPNALNLLILKEVQLN